MGKVDVSRLGSSPRIPYNFGSNATSPLHSALDKYGGKYSQHVMAGAVVVQLAMPAVKWVRTKPWRKEYRLSIGGSDSIYPDLHEWVLAQMPESERKAMLVDTRFPDPTDDTPYVRLRYDGSRAQKVEIDGESVTVFVSREDLPGGVENLHDNWRRFLEKITFNCSTGKGRDAVVRMINQLAEDRANQDTRPPLLIPGRWSGEWNPRDDLKPRSLESVVLKTGQLEALVADLGGFLSSEDEYQRLCQPWHRGYLFCGQPGTGKTSVAQALAHHFDMPVYYLPLGDLKKDTDLMNLIQNVQPRSMLLVEDVDVYHAATQRSDADSKVSIAAMLNAIDGIWTPNGLITVLTTNHKDSLDDALIRAGRIDVTENFTSLDVDQADRLIRYAGSAPSPGDLDYFVGKSPAELMEAIRATRLSQPRQIHQGAAA